jgi:hypothetical protein
MHETVQVMVEEGTTPLDFLKAVYMNAKLPLHTRLKAACEAAPYVHPKLAVTAVISGQDYADRLHRAIERSQSPKLIEAPPEATPVPSEAQNAGRRRA